MEIKQIKSKKNKVIVGRFGKIHGNKGNINVQSFLSIKKDIIHFKEFFVDEHDEIQIKFDPTHKKIIGKINEIKNPEDVKKYIGKLISIRRTSLPKLNKNQFYFNDLVKLKVYVSEKKIGQVNAVKNHGAGDYLEIKKGKSEILVPINNHHILKIDLEEERITLNSEYYEV